MEGRYGRRDEISLVYTCIFELNANYIQELNKIPEISDWYKLGAKLNYVFYQYLSNEK